MSLTKVNYIDNSTIITAKNLNDIQDNIIQNAELIKKASPRNLLDNSDFRNPVNQRGYTRYTSESKPETNADPNTCYDLTHGTTIDRWFMWSESGNTTVSVHDGYIAFSVSYHGTLNQHFPKGILNPSKSYTLVIKKPNELPVLRYPCYITYDWPVADTVPIADIRNGDSVSFEWVALYEGEYTIDTLPEYQPKGYGAELAECMRYYEEITVESSGILPAVMWNGESHRCMFNVPFTLKKRIHSPTVTVIGLMAGGISRFVSSAGIVTVESFTVLSATEYSVGVAAEFPEPLSGGASFGWVDTFKVIVDADL